MLIESPQNEKIKHLQRLNSDNRFRKKAELFVVEGNQENDRALQFGFTPEYFFICEEIYEGDFPKGSIHLVTAAIYEKIAYRGTSEGIIGIYKTKTSDLQNFKPTENASVIIVESIEKPGNLGAILRTCEAFGIEALIISDPKVDFYNPNVIRSSVGCLFGMKIFQSTNEDIFQFLTKNNFNTYTTYMDESAEYIFKKNLNEKSALLFGTEHSGLSPFWQGKAKNILVPMAGSIDSLNLSNAVAICCYEILRQKLIG
jgi:TrmH family RNA methyltransferase